MSEFTIHTTPTFTATQHRGICIMSTARSMYRHEFYRWFLSELTTRAEIQKFDVSLVRF